MQVTLHEIEQVSVRCRDYSTDEYDTYMYEITLIDDLGAAYTIRVFANDTLPLEPTDD